MAGVAVGAGLVVAALVGFDDADAAGCGTCTGIGVGVTGTVDAAVSAAWTSAGMPG